MKDSTSLSIFPDESRVKLMNDALPFEIQPGISPIVLAIPHTGDYIPTDILNRLTEIGQQRVDTDWHIHRLYDGLLPGATIIRALFHRYVIDANRDPAGCALYANRQESSLCPLFTFDGEPLYQPGVEPDDAEIEERIRCFHRPYHAAIEQALGDAMDTHGVAVLFDCHSIRSEVPSLFAGTLPDLNIGTDDGRSCDAALEDLICRVCDAHPDYSVVLNGVFRGGWTTRHHGKPNTAIHAIQMEIAQSNYMLESWPWTMDKIKTEKLRHVLAAAPHQLDRKDLSIEPHTTT